VGTIYLVCFDEPFSHARHYIGWTADLEARIARHLKGDGSNLLRHVQAAGIGWQVTGTWQGTRRDERAIKDRNEAPQYCPRCRAASGIKPLPGLRKHPLPEPYLVVASQ
jgi:predicted GIY-YIG superfamily endonuclease